MGIHDLVVGISGALARLGGLVARVEDRWSDWTVWLGRETPAEAPTPPRTDAFAGGPVEAPRAESPSLVHSAVAPLLSPAVAQAPAPTDAHPSLVVDVVCPSRRARRARTVPPRLDLALGWPHWPLVRGRRALMLGGTPSEPSRAAIAATFELSSLEWCSADPRRVGATAQRVSRGGFDLVIVNKFVRHRDSMRVADAAKAVGVPVIVVRRGFGTSAIREAIEHSRGSRRSHQ